MQFGVTHSSVSGSISEFRKESIHIIYPAYQFAALRVKTLSSGKHIKRMYVCSAQISIRIILWDIAFFFSLIH